MKLPYDEIEPTVKRLRRAQGQLAAVIKMIEEGRECDEIVTQFAACSKAIDRAGFSLIMTGMNCSNVSDEQERKQNLATLEKLFLSLA